MEVKNLFDPAVKQELVDRINKLSPVSQRKWGKMDVAQMLAHCGLPIRVMMGEHTTQSKGILKLILPLFKKILYNEKPYKQGLPTDKSYIMTGAAKNFSQEKENLLGLLNRFTETAVVIEKHPVFGRLTKEQWSKATWKHIDHHLKQFGV